MNMILFDIYNIYVFKCYDLWTGNIMITGLFWSKTNMRN